MKPTRATLQARGEADELQRRLGEIERRCGELETIVDERNESLQNLVLERDQLIAQRDELVMQNAEIGQQLVDHAVRYNQVVKDGERARDDARACEKGRLAAESDNAFLRDTMHELTIHKSRLEGQLERVREFDPVTDQQERREGLINVRMPRHYVDGEALTSSRSQPWYRRG